MIFATNGRVMDTKNQADFHEIQMESMTLDLARAFSDLRTLPRAFLLFDTKTKEFLKTKELKESHFSKAVQKQLVIIDLKSQQVFGNGKSTWEDISEEPEVAKPNKGKNHRSSQGDRKTKKKQRAKASNRKTRRSKSDE